MNVSLSQILAAAVFQTVFVLSARDVKPAETYGNFHTMGVVLDAPQGVKPADINRSKHKRISHSVAKAGHGQQHLAGDS